MGSPPIRTITLGVAEPHPIAPRVVSEAVARLRRAEAGFRNAGYEVQTVRLSTRAVFADMADRKPDEIVSYAHSLQRVLDDLGVAFCSLGPAPAADPGFPLDRLDAIADLLVGAPSIICTVQLGTAEHGVRAEAAPYAALVIRRLADETPEGFGNFNFAGLACVEPGGPFFPAAYHDGPETFTIGLQGASVARAALEGLDGPGSSEAPAPEEITTRTRDALTRAATPVIALAGELAERIGTPFGGIDLSPAPAGEDSIAAALESCVGAPIGSPGTLTAAAALTRGIQTTGLPTRGYNGLMLPVMEDVLLARRWAERHVNAQQLLAYSAVCGTGLDTVPLPGDATRDQLARLLLDVATLAVRLRKPLSARLFPVPGTISGDRTAFTSPYLVNTVTGW
ncbi:DUF711 family protein [Bailinhaonella thermotolerans]|uniref:DUF711 family protein n=1 Tax=Bailinhaonella thermotolerans TaxID=1070861 RepID=A0A3A4ASA1_9ACTN|nr:DUF711 family protein [Bailinhaonella thermotolerans]RJL32768.1 DUF711 family protein [Bailinhaonella thermotolerans]